MTTPKPIRLTINGHAVDAPVGASVAAAVAMHGLHLRRSPRGEMRAPLCGMGVCFECRVRIDGIAQQRACMVEAREGMRVQTDD